MLAFGSVSKYSLNNSPLHQKLSLKAEMVWPLAILSIFYIGCGGERLNVSKALVETSWQSSSFKDPQGGEHCFQQTVSRSGEWDYFHSDKYPDSSDYQWLLIKLTRGVRVSSVTVHARSDHKEPKEIIRASDIEILLSDKLPYGLSSNSGGCNFNITPNISTFSLCGKTSFKENSNLVHEVKCRYSDCDDLTQYILMRKNVSDQQEKYINFKFLEIYDTSDRSQFLSCKSGRGNLNCKVGVKCLKYNELVAFKVRLPCRIETRENQDCGVRYLSNGTNSATKFVAVINDMSTYVFEFQVEAWMHGSMLQCIFRCQSGEIRNLSETMGLFVRAKEVTLTLNNKLFINNQNFWAIGKDSFFYFTTDSAFPKPEHRCRLNPLPMTDWTDIGPGQLLTPEEETPSNRTPSSNSVTVYSLISKFKLRVSASFENWQIFCKSQMQGTTVRMENIPKLLYPCKTRITLPPMNKWKNGETVNVTAASSDECLLAVSYTCLLNTKTENSSLIAISKTMTSSTFSINLRRQWGNAASIECLVNQSGIFHSQMNKSLPQVLYKANVSLQLQQLFKCAGSKAKILLRSGYDIGHPPAEFHCRIGGNQIDWIGELGNFTQLPQHNGQVFNCQVVQTLSENSNTVYTQEMQVNPKMEVKLLSHDGGDDLSTDPANSSWTATQQIVVKEGELLSVAVTSVGGNPVPSHQCWLQSFNGSVVMTRLTNSTLSTVVSNFSVISNRSMSGGFLICNVTHECANQSIVQNVTVFYKASAKVKHPSSTCSGANETIEITESDIGNPPARYNCSVAGRQICKVQSSQSCQFQPIDTDNRTQIRCDALQLDSSKRTIYIQKVDGTNIINVNYPADSSWTAIQQIKVKEGELLSVAVTSVGGNPVPSHQCWLHSTNRSVVMMKHSGSSDVRNFSVISHRFMSGGFLKCEVVHRCANKSFVQNLTVFYPANMSIKDDAFSGSQVNFTLEVSEGNPQPKVICFLKYSTNNTSINSSYLSNGTHHLYFNLTEDSRMSAVNISCTISQFLNTSVPPKMFFNTSTWTVQTRLRENQVNTNPSPVDKSKLVAISASLLSLLIAAAVIAFAVAFGVRKRRQPSTDDIDIPVRRDSLKSELEFMKFHYLYRDNPRMEYASVVGVKPAPPNWASSTDTLFTEIIRDLD